MLFTADEIFTNTRESLTRQHFWKYWHFTLLWISPTAVKIHTKLISKRYAFGWDSFYAFKSFGSENNSRIIKFLRRRRFGFISPPHNNFVRKCRRVFPLCGSLFRRALLICDVMLLGILDHKPPEFHYALVNKEPAKTIANGTIRIIASGFLSVCHPYYRHHLLFILSPSPLPFLSRSLALRLNATVFTSPTLSHFLSTSDDTDRQSKSLRCCQESIFGLESLLLAREIRKE